MCAARPSRANSRKVRKKSGKGRDGSLSSIPQSRAFFGSQVDRYHRTSFPLVMDLSSDDEMQDPAGMMDTDESVACLPFQQLPELCKIKIWSFLQQNDLGRCMLVCTEWCHLIQKPYLWSSVRFSALSYSCLPHDHQGPVHKDPICHHCFRKRVFSFSKFLYRIKPVVKQFQFCLDLSHPTDQFNAVVEQFLDTAKLNLLTHADMNWKESPSRAPLDQESVQDYMYRYRRRQRVFSRIFDRFVTLSPQISTLVIPFDWTDENIRSLCHLKGLENLVLEKYGVFNHIFTQHHLTVLMKSLVNLKKLLLEVWIPSCNNGGMEVYCIASSSLTFLDISQCRGFYIKNLNTPNLLNLRMARRPWRQILLQSQTLHLPCLCAVLLEGAPQIQEINGFHLERHSLMQPPEELSTLMNTVCCCVRHRTVSGIEMYGM
ncbi:Zinc finger protein 62 homolog isoform x2 [Plakobranchus ocellatus]|uniref:Zinc finger protein 62 homolog isoform x2 n=1 Tax=Plakobranchus ocellatus TaxID=259542 RepID=A0AAV4DD50_9GAST|nr:Zinc finger protein 62 homolog isoform x2 [Plakobranchus ocellatus]